MKKYEEWQHQDLHSFLEIGDMVDQAMADYFIQNGQKLRGGSVVQMNEPVDILAGEPTYDTLIKTKSGYWYAGCCFFDETYNREPRLMQKIYIVSRYAGKTKKEKKFNRKVTEYVARTIYDQGNIPVAPHLYFPEFLDDDNPIERETGMAMGHMLMDHCTSFIIVQVDGVISEGMAQDIAELSRRNIRQGTHWAVTKERLKEMMKAVR